MNLLPNDNLAGFAQKNLFTEKRFVFVDDKKDGRGDIENRKSEIASGVEIEEIKPVDPEIKEVGWGVREKALDLGIITGTRQKMDVIAENTPENLNGLLRELADYEEALQGVELSASDFRDMMGFEMLGGEYSVDAEGKLLTQRPVRRYGALTTGDEDVYVGYNDFVSECYEQLLKINTKLKDQPNRQAWMRELFAKARSEIEEKREETQAALLKEKRLLLEKIVAKIAEPRQKLTEALNVLETQSAGSEELGEFIEEVKGKTGLAEEDWAEQILSGDLRPKQLKNLEQELIYQTSKVKTRIKRQKRLVELEQQANSKEDFIAELKGRVEILRQTLDSLAEGLPKIPSFLAKSQELVITFQKTLAQDLTKILANELVTIEESLPALEERYLQTDQAVLSREIEENLALTVEFSNRSANDLFQTFQSEAQALDTTLRQTTYQNQEAQEVVALLKYHLNDLVAEVHDKKRRRRSLDTVAFSLNALDEHGEIKKEEFNDVKKAWLIEKIRRLRGVQKSWESLQNDPNLSLREGISELVAKKKSEQYLQDILTASDPLQVVERLRADQHLQIVAAATFQKEYRDTGITNADLVIELASNDYHPNTPNYAEPDWMIYVDEAYYAKIKNGAGDRGRFRARIAHELGHREFEVSVKKDLQDEQFYTQAKWQDLKSEFNRILAGKKVGDSATGFTKDENVANELYALRQENAVADIVDSDLSALVEEFDALVTPIVGEAKKPAQKNTFGAVAETGKKEEEREGEDENQLEKDLMQKESENESEMQERSENQQAEINGLKINLNKLKKTLIAFGVSVNGDEQVKKEEQKEFLDISKYAADGPDFVEQVAIFYAHVSQQMTHETTVKMSDVESWNKQAIIYLDALQKVEDYLSQKGREKGSYLQNLRKNTRFLSLHDLYEMGKECWELAQKRRERNAAEARAQVGQRLFGGIPWLDVLANEYLSKEQDLELEAVGDYEKNLKNMSHENIYPLLFKPKNRDHLKAVINVLCSNGYMRWDDPRIWDVFKRFSFVRIPNREKAKDDIEYRNDWLKKIVADIWDEDTWDGWQKSQDSGLSSSLSDFSKRSETLHAMGAIPVRNKLNEILENYKKNYDVNFGNSKSEQAITPDLHYHKLLDYAFEAGKLQMEDKFYFLIQGVRYGILTVEDFRKMQTERFQLLPLLDFFYGKNNTYSEISALSDYIEQNGGLPNGVHKILMKQVLEDPSALDRVWKRVTTDASKIDHDDWQAIMAIVKPSMIERILGKRHGTSAEISELAIINGMTSFSSFAKGQAALVQEKPDQFNYELFGVSLRSFLVYDSMLTGRKGEKFFTLDSSGFNKVPMPSGLKVRDYQQSMYDLLRLIFQNYHDKEGEEYVNLLSQDISGLDLEEKAAKCKSENWDKAINSLTKKVEEIIKNPQGRKAIAEALKQIESGHVEKRMSTYAKDGRGFEHLDV